MATNNNADEKSLPSNLSSHRMKQLAAGHLDILDHITHNASYKQ